MNLEIKSALGSNDNWNIDVIGEVDIYNCDEFKSKIGELFETKQLSLRFNLENLTYIDSTGLGAFVSLLKKVKTYSKSISLYNVKPNVLKIFKITDLDKVFNIENNEVE